MKTIYECSQSKVIKWFTAIFFLIIIGSVLLVIYQASRGMDPTEPILVTALLLIVSVSCFFIFPLYIVADDEGIGVQTALGHPRLVCPLLHRIGCDLGVGEVLGHMCSEYGVDM